MKLVYLFPFVLFACATTAKPSRQSVSADIPAEKSSDSRSLLSKASKEEAKAQRAQVLSRKDLNEVLMASAADLTLDTGDTEAAISEARVLLKKDYKNVAALKVLIRATISKKKYQESHLMATNAMALAANDADLINLRGLASYQMGNHNDAQADWKRAIKLNPIHVPAQMNLACLSFQFRYINQAGALFDRVLSANPQLSDAIVGKALVLSAQGSNEQARGMLLSELKKHPDSSLVLYNLSSLERVRFQNPTAALSYLDRALKIPGQERKVIEKGIALRQTLQTQSSAKPLSDGDLNAMAAKSQAGASDNVTSEAASDTARGPADASKAAEKSETEMLEDQIK